MFPLVAVLAFSAPEGFTITPDIHHDKVAFSSEGDIWIGDLTTGRAERLTSDEGREVQPKFSPDGKTIAFQAQYDGLSGVYSMPVSGGAPTKLVYTQRESLPSVFGFKADGQHVVYGTSGPNVRFTPYAVPLKGGAPERLPLEFVSFIDWAPSGDSYAFTRFALASDSWFRYIGGMQNQVWTYSGGKFRQITNVQGHCEFPAWVGDDVYFVNEENARFRIMRVPASGGPVKTVVGPYDMPLRNLSGGPGRLVYEKGNTLEALDPVSGKTDVLRLERSSDKRHTTPYLFPAERLATAPALSAGNKRVFLESRGQLVSLPVGDGEARVWKSMPGVRLRAPLPSPDGKRLAYWTDESGEVQLAVANTDGSAEKVLTKGRDRQFTRMKWAPDSSSILLADSNADLSLVRVSDGQTTLVANVPTSPWTGKSADFSPDSKWIAYVTVLDKGSLNQVMLFEIATGKVTKVSNGLTNDTEVAFSPDGKYLALLSDRRFPVKWDPVLNQMNTSDTSAPCLLLLDSDTPDPLAPTDTTDAEAPKAKQDGTAPVTHVDVDGLYDRLVELPLRGQFTQIAVSKDKVFVGDGTKVSTYDFTTKATGVLTQATTFQLSYDGTKVLLPGDPVRVVDATGSNLPATQGALAFGGLKLRVEPVSEWRQIFRDAWRHFRDYFYVRNMHGVDWPGVYAKYSAMLPSVASRSELDLMIRWMEGELGCSHMGLGPGDVRATKTLSTPAFLGVEVEPDVSGYYKLSKVFRGDGTAGTRSPLAAPHLKVTEGLFLIEIAGVPCRVGEDIYAGLVGRSGETVTVKVNDKPTEVGARSVLVKPVASESRMRYVDWVETNRSYVGKVSGGKIGYLHLRDMTEASMSDFIKLYFGQRDKDAMVVDVRFNSGGNTQEIMNRILNASLSAFFNQRNSTISWTRQGDYFDGPMACLINEFNISCGEEFPYRFRELKRGKVIGRRTMGGEVGNWPGWPLADGGKVWVPNYGMYSPERGWEIEGRGVEPDIDVPSDPNAYAIGKDPQLDRAVSWLQDELKRWPVRPINPPKDRDRSSGG